MSKYKAFCKVKWPEERIDSYAPQLSWSRKNRIAYVSVPLTGVTAEIGYSRDICISDPNRPWRSVSIITNHKCSIEHVVWDALGVRFFTVDSEGCCKIWRKNCLAGNWEVYHSFKPVNEEKMVFAGWIGHELDIGWEQNSRSLVAAKGFSSKDSKPCLTDIGGQQENAVLLVSDTGYVHVVIATPPCNSVGCCLGITRFKTVLGSATYTESGKILVATLNAIGEIEVFALTISFNCPKYAIHIEYYPCLTPSVQGDRSDCCISSIAFPLVGNVENLMVGISSSTCHVIRRYELRREQLVLHPQLKRSSDQGTSTTQQVWHCLISETISCAPKLMCLPRLPFVPSSSSLPLAIQQAIQSSIIVSDGSEKVLLLDSHSLATKSSSTVPLEDDETIVSLSFSPGDTCLAAMTSRGSLVLMLNAATEQLDDSFKAAALSNMLLYCLSSHVSFWEVSLLASYHSNSVVEQCMMSMVDVMTDKGFSVADPSMQSLHVFARLFTAMRDSYYGASVCYNTMRLIGIYSYISSVFDGISTDKDTNVLTVIQNICARPNEYDVRKLSKGVDVRDGMAAFEDFGQLQNFLHWVVEFSAQIAQLFLSPSARSSHVILLVNILQVTALHLLRELLLLLYVLMQNNIFSHQQFFPSIPFEFLPSMFRFMTKLKALNVMDGNFDPCSVDDVPLRSMHTMHYSLIANEPCASVISKNNKFTASLDYYLFDMDRETLSGLQHPLRYYSACNPLMTGRLTESKRRTTIYDGISCCHVTASKSDMVQRCMTCLCTTLLLQGDNNQHCNRWLHRWTTMCLCQGEWENIDFEYNDEKG